MDLFGETLEEVRQKILSFLPVGWTFEEETIGEVFRVRLRHEVIEWEACHIDLQWLLLSACGYLWSKKHRPAPDSPWVRRHNPIAKTVTSRMVGLPDPEDLDPKEIESVYKAQRRN